LEYQSNEKVQKSGNKFTRFLLDDGKVTSIVITCSSLLANGVPKKGVYENLTYINREGYLQKNTRQSTMEGPAAMP
jgi:hypothetical protein